ncbi:MAG: septum formation initiator family protein [Alphaproteobacteria bacterium]|nr:septum formation initiator family protein [Alphaproteobacteria bacterium]
MSRLNKKLQKTLWSVVGACIVGYFVYHTVQGDRGWFAMLHMEREVKTAQATLEKLQKDRQELQHRTQLLHANSLDPDLLEEKSRELLNYSKPNEIVILTPQSKDVPAKAEEGKESPAPFGGK